MKLIDLHGKTHNLNISPYTRTNDRPRSDLHIRARELIRKAYPFDIVAEEVPVPGEHLFLDFFIPRQKICVEVQGQQHSNFSVFFHGTKHKFIASQERDYRKSEWCKINGLILITLEYNEKPEIWEQKLTKKQTTIQ